MALDIKDTVGTVKDTVGTVTGRVGTITRQIARDLPKQVGSDSQAKRRLARGSMRWTRQINRRQGGPRGSRLVVMLLGAAAGATVLYFLDSQRGAARRAQAKDQLGAILRRGTGGVTQLTKRAGGNASGWSQKMVNLRSGQRPVDDLTLRDRVESEIFRNTELPKGRINLDVDSAIVTVRGQVDSAYEITTIEKAVLKVPGVNGVENLLHVQGTPAPNKAEARQSAN